VSELVVLLFLLPPLCITGVWLYVQLKGISPPHHDVPQLLEAGKAASQNGRTKKADSYFDAALEISRKDPEVVAKVSEFKSGGDVD